MLYIAFLVRVAYSLLKIEVKSRHHIILLESDVANSLIEYVSLMHEVLDLKPLLGQPA